MPRVARSIVKMANRVDSIDDILDYIELIGKIHHKNGIMVRRGGESCRWGCYPTGLPTSRVPLYGVV